MLLLVLTIFLLFHIIRYVIARKKTHPTAIKVKDLKRTFLEMDWLEVKGFIAKQMIVIINLFLLGFFIRNWGFSFLGVLAQHEKINPLAHFLYNQLTRTQIYDFGEFIIFYGYLVYLVTQSYGWSKLTLKRAKKESKLKEKSHETR